VDASEVLSAVNDIKEDREMKNENWDIIKKYQGELSIEINQKWLFNQGNHMGNVNFMLKYSAYLDSLSYILEYIHTPQKKKKRNLSGELIMKNILKGVKGWNK